MIVLFFTFTFCSITIRKAFFFKKTSVQKLKKKGQTTGLNSRADGFFHTRIFKIFKIKHDKNRVIKVSQNIDSPKAKAFKKWARTLRLFWPKVSTWEENWDILFQICVARFRFDVDFWNISTRGVARGNIFRQWSAERTDRTFKTSLLQRKSILIDRPKKWPLRASKPLLWVT